MRYLITTLLLLTSTAFASSDSSELLRQYNFMSYKIRALYADDVQRLTGKGLYFKFKNGKKHQYANAWVDRESTYYNINITEGLVRLFNKTPDALALTICHELGHIIGGAPHKVQTFVNIFGQVEKVEKLWSMAEAQADYFATAKCFKRVFEKDDNESAVSKLRFRKEIKDACRKSYDNDNDYYICLRTVKAIEVESDYFARNGGENTDILTPDKSIAKKTISGYPSAQCRIDTFWQGALCNADPYVDADNTDPSIGYCKATFHSRVGARPRCWYRKK